MFFFCLTLLVSPTRAMASDYRLTMGIGFGGAGIGETFGAGATATTTKTTSSTGSSSTTTPTTTVKGLVQRSEGPGAFHIGVEKIISARRTINFEHARGFRLGPFSSGVAFTGLHGRYYFSPINWGDKDLKKGTILFIKRAQSFVGFGLGLASGTISRPGDKVETVEGSGIFISFRGGFDIPLNPQGMGIRPEIISSMTIMSGGLNPAKLTLFSVGCGFYYQL